VVYVVVKTVFDNLENSRSCTPHRNLKPEDMIKNGLSAPCMKEPRATTRRRLDQ